MDNVIKFEDYMKDKKLQDLIKSNRFLKVLEGKNLKVQELIKKSKELNKTDMFLPLSSGEKDYDRGYYYCSSCEKVVDYNIKNKEYESINDIKCCVNFNGNHSEEIVIDDAAYNYTYIADIINFNDVFYLVIYVIEKKLEASGVSYIVDIDKVFLSTYLDIPYSEPGLENRSTYFFSDFKTNDMTVNYADMYFFNIGKERYSNNSRIFNYSSYRKYHNIPELLSMIFVYKRQGDSDIYKKVNDKFEFNAYISLDSIYKFIDHNYKKYVVGKSSLSDNLSYELFLNLIGEDNIYGDKDKFVFANQNYWGSVFINYLVFTVNYAPFVVKSFPFEQLATELSTSGVFLDFGDVMYMLSRNLLGKTFKEFFIDKKTFDLLKDNNLLIALNISYALRSLLGHKDYSVALSNIIKDKDSLNGLKIVAYTDDKSSFVELLDMIYKIGRDIDKKYVDVVKLFKTISLNYDLVDKDFRSFVLYYTLYLKNVVEYSDLESEGLDILYPTNIRECGLKLKLKYFPDYKDLKAKSDEIKKLQDMKQARKKNIIKNLREDREKK